MHISLNSCTHKFVRLCLTPHFMWGQNSLMLFTPKRVLQVSPPKG